MEKSAIKLSYITVTKNKLPYFKQGIEKLIANKKPGEEILVADGDSTDGTKEYLAELKRTGQIDDYISEPDFSESHALNKMFLRAKGELVKIINDDDAYYYPVIEACKKFMLEHPEIDVMGMEGGSFKHVTPDRQEILQVAGYAENFRKWKEHHAKWKEGGGKPFEFAVLGLMFRRSSLPFLGFWDLSFKNADAEYTFRITAGPAKLAWCLSPAFVFIRTIDGVTWKNLKRMKIEAERLRKFYLDEDPPSEIRIAVKRILREALRIAMFRKKIAPNEFGTPWETLYAKGAAWLIDQNKDRKVEFLS
jgi:glycosyltransferase involved in cell wall biosynthesis